MEPVEVCYVDGFIQKFSKILQKMNFPKDIFQKWKDATSLTTVVSVLLIIRLDLTTNVDWFQIGFYHFSSYLGHLSTTFPSKVTRCLTLCVFFNEQIFSQDDERCSK